MKTLQTSVRASETIAIGRAFVLCRNSVEQNIAQGSVEEEKARFLTSLQHSSEQIEALAVDSDIFAAHLEIVQDEMLSDAVMEHIGSGSSAVEACQAACADLVAMFEAMDDE